MQKKKLLIKTILILNIILITIYSSNVQAHSGRTDKYGGHKDNKNASGLGNYHYHCGGHPAHLHTNGVCPYTNSGNKSQNATTQEKAKQTSISVQTIKIENESNKIELKIGETLKLNSTITPANATNKIIAWTSSNNEIATVDSSGTVKAISSGEVTITAKSDNSKQDILKLIVKRNPVLVEKININNSVSTINVGDEMVLDITVVPEDADNKEVSISSSNTGVLKIIDNKIQAVGSGDAVVTVTSKDGNANNSFNVSVVDVKVEEDFNEKSMENNSSLNETASTDESDSIGSGGAVALLGAYGGIAYVLYRKNKKR